MTGGMFALDLPQVAQWPETARMAVGTAAVFCPLTAAIVIFLAVAHLRQSRQASRSG